MAKENNNQKVGRVGEKVAAKFLQKKGFSLIGFNYRKKWGEIDVIVTKAGVYHFVEVKTVSRENIRLISQETSHYRPEDNVHPWKLERLGRAVQTYLLDHNLDDVEWQCDVVTVFLDLKSKEARVEILENIMLL